MFNIAIINLEREVSVLWRIAEVNYPQYEIRNKVYDLIRCIIVHMVYKNNPYLDLFKRNDIIPNGGINYVPELYYDLDEQLKLFTKGTMYDSNAIWMGEIIHSIADTVSPYYNKNKYNYIRFTEENGMSILKNYGDIRTIRYEEAIEQLKIEAQLQSYEFFGE